MRMTSNIHPTAIIKPGAQIGEGCTIGAYSIIGELAQIGAGTVIGSHCEIGTESGSLPPAPLVIGDGSLIRSGSILYQGSTFGPNLRTGHKVIVREGTIAGEDLQIGSLSDIQGHCTIGDHVRLHSNVHVGQRTRIGDFVWLFPYVVLTNDPHPPSYEMQGCQVGEFAVLATKVVVLPGKRIGRDALVGAMTLVRDDVPGAMICIGTPGRLIGSISRVRFKGDGSPVYPWRRHFHRGYPDDVVSGWRKEFTP